MISTESGLVTEDVITSNPPARQLKILFVDDNKRPSYFGLTFIEPEPDITIVESAEDAIECLKSGDYDLMYLDCELRGQLTGYDVLNWLADNRIHIPRRIHCISANFQHLDRMTQMSTLLTDRKKV